MRRKSFIKDHPIIFYIIIIAAIFFALNIGLFLPLHVLDILYDIEHTIIRLFTASMIIQRWELLIILFVTAAVGYFIFPIVWIPSTGDWYIYKRQWTDGKLHYFETLSGKIIALNEDWVARKWMKYVLLGEVESIAEQENGDIIAYQSKELEVTKALIVEEHIRALERKILQLEKDMEKGAVVLSPDVVEAILKIAAKLEERK